MGIYFNEQTKTFYLETATTSYVFGLNEEGFLKHLHYGGKIAREDIGSLQIKKLHDCIYDSAKEIFSLGHDCYEYNTFGLGDYRETSLRLTYPNGSRINDFKYVSHKITNKKPIKGMPSLRGGKNLVINLKDGDYEVNLYYAVYEKEDAITRRVEVVNHSKSPLIINSVMSAQLDFDENGFDMVSLCGSWANEAKVVKSPMTQGIRLIDSKKGTSSHNLNPFVALARKGATEFLGDVYGVNLVYSGSFKIAVEETGYNTTRLIAGINDCDFSWKLLKGQTFSSPEAVFVYSSKGFNKMSQSFHDLYRNYLINPNFVFKQRPILLNNWESTYFDFDNEKLCTLIDKASALGVDTFVLDDGWFGARNNDRAGLGDWFVNEEKLKGGLKTVIDRCKMRGIKFGLWFEPEMVNEDSDLFRTHPNWVIRAGDRIINRSRNQVVLDFANQEVVDYIKGAVGDILKNNDISYVKWDMNRCLSEYSSLVLPKDRQGELMHRYVLGVYDLAEYLTTEFPEVLFEGCASGGGRFDPAMLYYFPQIWTSDNTDAVSRQFIQYGTSMCYPLSSMSGHVSICPNHQTSRVTPFKTRCDVASLCSTGYELNFDHLTEEELAIVKQNIARYHEISDLILRGDSYRLDSPFEGNYFTQMVVSKDKEEAFAVCAKILTRVQENYRYVKFIGLNEDYNYYVKEIDKTFKGSTLVNFGLPAKFNNCDFTTVCFTFKRVQ